MKQKAVLLCVILLLGLHTLSGSTNQTNYRPSEHEVKVALQGLIVASSATLGATLFPQSINFRESQLTLEGIFASGTLILVDADVGQMRTTLLTTPRTEEPKMSLFEMLRSSLNPFGFSLNEILGYLQVQRVLAGEIIYSGELSFQREFRSFPLRYEAGGKVVVSGSRFAQSFTLKVDFYFPFEGTRASQIIPRLIEANGYDFLAVGQALFGLE